mmetsp:Transcript_128605/g.359869  ORF Transcript_128605/g.359869 Transcript_128605/m.359869 type:complete len:447 (+) Transcript_128605:56-1396(+)
MVAAATAVRLTAWQPGLAKGESPQGGLSAADAARELLAAIHSPIMLEWEVSLACGASALLTAELAPQQTVTWPPPKVTFKMRPNCPRLGGEDRLTISLPSVAPVDRLESILASGAAPCQAEAPAIALALQRVADADRGCEACAAAATQHMAREHVNYSSSQSPSVPLVGEDEQHGVLQPLCLEQWHHDVCGHHALFSASCILRGQAGRLLDERSFWASTLHSVTVLAEHGEGSGLWPKSRVICGAVDDTHLRHLVESDEFLRERLSVFFCREVFEVELANPGSRVSLAVEAVRTGRSSSYGFLLGATSHWYAMVAVGAEQSGTGRPQLWLCDSYNKPLTSLCMAADVDAMVERLLDSRRNAVYESLRRSPEWAHRPEQHLAGAFEQGVQEWWKGTLKAPLFWQHRPLAVRRELKRQELMDVRWYLQRLAGRLGLRSADDDGCGQGA